MDKTLRNVIIAGIIIVALSVGYYLVLKPKTEFEACYGRCTNLNTLNSDQKFCLSFCGYNK